MNALPRLGVLEGLRARVVSSVPRAAQDGAPDPVPGQLHAALIAAHARLQGQPSGSVAALWARPQGRRSATFVVGSRPLEVLTSGFPPGAVTRPLEEEWVADLLAAFPLWVRCMGRADHARDTGQDEVLAPLRGSFEDVAAHLAPPWAWLVVAEPLAAPVAVEESGRVGARLASLRPQESSEKAQVQARRDRGRYAELEDARATGLWAVHVLVGGDEQVSGQAAVLCAAADAHRLRYRLAPAGPPGPLAAAWADRTVDPDGDSSPFSASSALVSALCRPPARELPGVRATARHRFDLTPEPVADGPSVVLGDVLDEALRPAQPFRVPLSTLNRHAFVCGATGSGKSQTVRHLLESLTRADPPVPWLVIEPAKAEYARMAGRVAGVGEVTVVRPGDPDLPPACLNPLEPEPGFPLRSHVDLVRALFTAAFQAVEPFPQVLSRAVTMCYERAGWDLVTGDPHPALKPKFRSDEPDEPATPAYPNLTQLQATAQEVVDAIGYGPEITANVRGFVDVRIGSLREGTPGRFFEGGHPLDIAALLDRNAVLEIEGVTDDRDKAFLIGAVIIRIVEHLRVHRPHHTGGLAHLLVIEEAHRLLRAGVDGAAAQAVELFAALLAEVRAYGQGVLVAEQIPSKLIPDVIKNTALKVVHRLPAADDRATVGATINLTREQSEYVVALPPGRAAAAIDGADRPLLVQVPLGEAREDATGLVTAVPLRAARSPLCPADCTTTPCTLRQLRAAEHLAQDPHMTVWTDLSVAALVTMRPQPQTATAWSARVATLDARLRPCAIALAVERSAAARGSTVARWVDLHDLAYFVASELRGEAPTGDARRFAAGPFRWLDVRRDTAARESNGKPVPALVLDEWWRRGVPGFDGTGRLDKWPTTPAERDHGLAVGVALGDTAASGLLAAVATLGYGHGTAFADVAGTVVVAETARPLLEALDAFLASDDRDASWDTRA